MAFIGYIDYENAPPELRELYDMLGAPRRTPGNIIRISGVSPRAMEGHITLYRSIMAGKSSLTPQQREMIAVVVSGINKCHY